VIHPLHGGYAAQTFAVDSFDREGRKMRPTVLKIADRDMIIRESDRCRQYALPYIMNNSAMILGTEFFGNAAALCYNFVGIGGEQTRLEWLTRYFETWPVEKLGPLFDKIFLQILKPWYGQPVRETIHPFRDHNPTRTFFPRICETAAELFSISSDDPAVTVAETGQEITNPYWFLKNIYEERKEYALEYHTAVCHGDLNMQNILLDQDMNVYLIDFSETRPRSVVSDFARLEAIFMIEYAAVETTADLKAMIEFFTRFYAAETLDRFPENTYGGRDIEAMQRNVAMTLKMREYALKSAHQEPAVLPYYMALLEWVLPVICYRSATTAQKRLSMVLAGLLCERVG
jgi:hypothetical protein